MGTPLQTSAMETSLAALSARALAPYANMSPRELAKTLNRVNNESILVKQKNPFRNPCCESLISLCFSRCSLILLAMIDSKIFPTVVVKLTGL